MLTVRCRRVHILVETATIERGGEARTGPFHCTVVQCVQLRRCRALRIERFLPAFRRSPATRVGRPIRLPRLPSCQELASSSTAAKCFSRPPRVSAEDPTRSSRPAASRPSAFQRKVHRCPVAAPRAGARSRNRRAGGSQGGSEETSLMAGNHCTGWSADRSDLRVSCTSTPAQQWEHAPVSIVVSFATVRRPSLGPSAHHQQAPCLVANHRGRSLTDLESELTRYRTVRGRPGLDSATGDNDGGGGPTGE